MPAAQPISGAGGIARTTALGYPLLLRYLRPDATVDNVGWKGVPDNAALWRNVDEAALATSDWITLEFFNTTGTITLGLSNAPDPARNDQHVVLVAGDIEATGSQPPDYDLEVTVLSGAVAVATRTLANIGGSFTLTDAEAALIADYSDLRVRLTALGPGGGNVATGASRPRVYQVWMRVPAAGLGVGPSGIPSSAAVGSPVVAGPITASAIASSAAVGSPALGQHLRGAGAIPTAAAAGEPRIGAPIVPAGIASGAAVGQPEVRAPAFGVRPAGIGSEATPGAPSVSALYLTEPAGIPSSAAVGAARLGHLVRTSAIASTAAAGAPAITLHVQPAAIPSVASAGAPLFRLTLRPGGIETSAAPGVAFVVNLARNLEHSRRGVTDEESSDGASPERMVRASPGELARAGSGAERSAGGSAGEGTARGGATTE